MLVERRRTLHQIPKGQNLSPRTLEHFYFWGIVDELRAARLMPAGYSAGGVTAYKSLTSEYWIALSGREILGKYYFQSNDRLPQYLLETVLRRRLTALPSVDSRFGWSAKMIEQDDNGVRVTIAEEDGEGGDVIEADYVVGCDGGHSIVRDQIGIERGGTDFEQLMVLAVFRSRELHEGLKQFPPRSTFRVLHPDLKGYWQFFGRIDVGEGWFFHAPVPANTTKDNFDFHGLIQSVAGFKFAATFDYVGFWDMRIAVAEKYQVGRAFIAGDAAHSHPPYGGFGLNNGLEDAINLGWKLAATLQGWGGEALLRSYSEERRAIFKETAERFIAARIDDDAALLERYSPERDAAEFERAWKTIDDSVSARIMTYEPNYEGSPVVMGPPDGVSSAQGTHSFKARAGHHLAPQLLSDGRNVFEELGGGFALLAFDTQDDAVRAFEHAAQSRNVPLKIIRDSFDGGREQYEQRLILIRPDQYVAWTGDSPPADPGPIIAKAVGCV
jgi:2-polyprenyl-6-methoxyphenol hydroxylase-like FAD-dependent oxidoreductase